MPNGETTRWEKCLGSQVSSMKQEAMTLTTASASITGLPNEGNTDRGGPLSPYLSVGM